MKIQRVKSVMIKEWQEIFRNKLFFVLAFVVPIVLMILLGFGLSLDVENVPVIIIDNDHSALSREYSYRLQSSRYFNFLGRSNNSNQMMKMMMQNDVRAIIEIPENFEKNFYKQKRIHVRTIIDGTFPVRALITKGYLISMNTQFNLILTAKLFSSSLGISFKDALNSLMPIKLESRFLYNQGVESIWSIVPKLIMAILMVSPPFLTVVGVVREKETGSIYNIYASNITKLEFLIGKISPYVLISFFNAIVLLLMAIFIFHVPFKGSLLAYLISSFVYVLCTSGIGLVISIFVETQVAAMIISIIITLLPSVLYSGLLFPVSSFTASTNFIAHLLPTMYFTDIVDATFLRGEGLIKILPNLSVLILYVILLFSAGYFLFNKRPKI